MDEIEEIKRRRAAIEYKNQERDLKMARIPFSYLGLVPFEFRPFGAIKGISIHRSVGCYYWVAQGRVPLAVAQAIYADPAADDIRVNGDCTRPAPEKSHIKWFLPSGREVISMENKTECDGYMNSDSKVMREAAKHILDTYDFSDDPASLGASGFIDSYHIDSALGLRVFADYVR